MRILLKYFIWLLSILCLLIYYFLGTALGHKHIGYFLEDYYSKKMENKIEILSLNIENYPFIVAELRLNDRTELSLEGKSDREDMNLSYHLRGDAFLWNDYNITQPLNLKGRVSGKLSELLVKGEGEIFGGGVNYTFVRKASRMEDLEIFLKEASSTDLAKFLKYDIDLVGEIDILMNFEYFASFRKKGSVNIQMHEAQLPKVSGAVVFDLKGEIIYKDMLRNFSLDIASDIGKLRLAHGYYNKSAELMKAEYGLHIKELSYFKDFLGHEYKGELNTAGEVQYERQKLMLLGDTTTYGGLVKYHYNNDYLDLELQGVRLEKLLRQLTFPALLSAKVYGTASYDLKDGIVLVNTKLKETRFRRTKMTDKIYEFTDIDIRKDTYNNSIFTAAYENNVLTSFLQIDNGINHLYLRNTKMNSKTNKITADFEILIDDQEFLGEIEGTLEDPHVNLDMTRLIKYQINKKIENFFGRGKPLNRKNSEERLNKIKDDLNNNIKQKSRSFLKGFFN